MSHDTYNDAPIAWGSSASGGDVTVNSLYELREVLDRVAGAINYSPEYDGAFKNGNIRGNATLFEFDSDNNLVSANYVSESNGYYNNWENSWDYLSLYKSNKFEALNNL